MKRLLALVLALGVWSSAGATTWGCLAPSTTGYTVIVSIYNFIFNLVPILGGLYIFYGILKLSKYVTHKISSKSLFLIGLTSFGYALGKGNFIYAQALFDMNDMVPPSDLQCRRYDIWDALSYDFNPRFFYSELYQEILAISPFAILSLLGHIAILHLCYFAGKKIFKKLKKS